MYRQGLSRSTSLSRMDFRTLSSPTFRGRAVTLQSTDIYARANEYLQNRRYDLAMKSFEQLTPVRPDVRILLLCTYESVIDILNCILCSTSSSHSNSRRYESTCSDRKLYQGRSETTSQDERRSKLSRCEPHMLLAMPISPMLKLDIARHRANDEMRRVRSGNMIPYT